MHMFGRRITGNSSWAAAILPALLLAGCGGSDVGNQSHTPPTAIASVIGFKPSSAAGADPVAVTVRSRADVLLSGKDSDGVDAALTSTVWTQTDTDPAVPKVTLISRNSSTVSFTAPTVAQDATLNFRLTTTDAKGQSATANVRVLVKAVNDASEFLSYLATPHVFTVALATQEGMAAPLAADAPVCVTLDRRIQYRSRDYSQSPQARTVSLPAIKADVAWTSAVGGSAQTPNSAADFASYTNPRAVFNIPALDTDNLYVLFNQRQAGQNLVTPTQVAQQLVAADVDNATLIMAVTAAPGSCDGSVASSDLGTKTLRIAALDSSGTVVASNAAASAGSAVVLDQITPDMLLGSTGGIETRESAVAYYQALDPNGLKLTLNDWLDANCFVSTAKNYGADAHSVYTNNYDLGFGRDMYFTTCKADHLAGGTVTAHKDDMASVVINYPSLDAAANKVDSIIAVAMEYSAAADGSNPAKRFPKFYVFAPDDRDGKFKRVLTANFDRRGEKYVPGACTICHGGTVPAFVANQPYPQAGDVNSTFMPWDLDSLLYADTDPTFTGRSVDKSLYTRQAQESSLRQLNQLAYATYQTPQLVHVVDPVTHAQTDVDRFQAPRELVEKWYGGPGLPNATYTDAATPSGWVGQEDLYHKVMARNCRACHTQNETPDKQFTDYAKFISQYVANTADTTKSVQQLVYRDGRMPLARLTMDRFWVDYAGGDSAAKLLAAHIQQVTGQTDLLTASQTPVPPGKPLPNVVINGATAATPVLATRFNGVRVDASRSLYIAHYTWSLCLTPIGGSSCAARSLVGASSASPGFLANESGSYQLTLSADNGLGTVSTSSYVVTVPNKVPDISGCSTVQGVAISNLLTIDLASCLIAGDGASTVQLQDPGTLGWGTAVTALTYSASVSGTSIGFNYVPTATQPAHLVYRVCDSDNDCVQSFVDVPIVTTLTATDDVVSPTSLASLPLSITVASLSANDVVLPTNDLFTLNIMSQPPHGLVAPTSAAKSGSLTYSSTYVACDINGKDITDNTHTATCAGDTFTYRLTASNGTTHSNTANVAVKVTATTSFSQGGSSVFSFLGGTQCASCHAGSDVVATSKWKYLVGDPSGTWSTLAQWATKDFNGVATSNPSNAAIYDNPCNGANAHSLSTQRFDSTQCATVLQWIREGANLN